jgi:transcriptional regulator with XRE-family HTH domain
MFMPRNQLTAFDKQLRATISANLKKYTRHMTQGKLSDLTGIPESTLSGYFAERSTPHPGNVQKIADALNIDKSDIDPRFTKSDTDNSVFLKLTPKDEKDIQKRLSDILNDMDSQDAIAMYNGGEPMDPETREYMKASLENALRFAKLKAKEKFTPKKYRK